MITLFYYFIFFFFFNDTATTEIYTLSLHDALPILHPRRQRTGSSKAYTRPTDIPMRQVDAAAACRGCRSPRDRKSTRLNSSHSQISYAVFCLKKKKSTKNRKSRM